MIEKRVVSLATAKKLQKAGIKIDTAFVWMYHYNSGWQVILKSVLNSKYIENKKKKNQIIPAPLTGELLDLLPVEINIDGITQELNIYKFEDNGIITYNAEYFSTSSFTDKLPQEALSKLLMWCMEEGYV